MCFYRPLDALLVQCAENVEFKQHKDTRNVGKSVREEADSQTVTVRTLALGVVLHTCSVLLTSFKSKTIPPLTVNTQHSFVTRNEPLEKKTLNVTLKTQRKMDLELMRVVILFKNLLD